MPQHTASLSESNFIHVKENLRAKVWPVKPCENVQEMFKTVSRNGMHVAIR